MRALVLAASFLLSGPTAAATEIEILRTQYATDLYVLQREVGEQTFSEASAAPLNNTLHMDGPEYWSTAQASADTFEVSTRTAAFGGRAEASARTDVTFSPTSSGKSLLSFALVGSGMSHYSEGAFRLLDLTTNEYALDYYWRGIGYGQPPGTNIPNFSPFVEPRFIDFTVGLFNSHNYMLSMYVNTNASSDAQGFRIGVSGFVSAVPEPETYAMAAIGLVLLGTMLRSRKRQAAGAAAECS